MKWKYGQLHIDYEGAFVEEHGDAPGGVAYGEAAAGDVGVAGGFAAAGVVVGVGGAVEVDGFVVLHQAFPMAKKVVGGDVGGGVYFGEGAVVEVFIAGAGGVEVLEAEQAGCQ